MADWYCNFGDGSTTGYYAVAQYANNHAYSVGDIVRQLATPSVGNERCFVCTTAGTSGGSEPSWNLSENTNTTVGTAVFKNITGQSTYNWSAPFARLATAISLSPVTAGDRIFVGDNHAETQSTSITLRATPGTFNSPLQIICVNHLGSVPPAPADLRTTATVTTTGATTITFGSVSVASFYGITFTAGNSTNNGNITFAGGSPTSVFLDSCELVLGGSSASSLITVGSGSATASTDFIWNNTKVKFASTSQSINILGAFSSFQWTNTASAIDAGGSAPTHLFTSNANAQAPIVLLEGIDLSAISGTLFGAFSGPTSPRLINCTLNAGVTIATTPTAEGSKIFNIVSDNAAANYRQEIYAREGTLTASAANYRNGGASNGTTPISWEVVTTSNIGAIAAPFECFAISIWNSTVGSPVTAAIEIMNDGSTLTNSDIWMDVEYLGDTGTPICSPVTSAPATVLTADSNYPNSSASWTTSGITTPVLQQMAVTFTPQMAGEVRVTVKLAKASGTIYIDPIVEGVS